MNPEQTPLRVEGVVTVKNGNNLRIGRGIFISEGCRIIDDGAVEIGDDVIFGQRVQVIADPSAGVEIGAGAWVGDDAELRPGARVGAGAMVCAGSIVEGDVPPNAVVEGRPAKVTWYLR